MATHTINGNTTHIILGPRTRREIELQIRQLEGRLKPNIYDLAELARLRDLLKSTEGRQW